MKMFLYVISILLFSCSDNSGQEGYQVNQFLGTWKLTATYQTKLDGSADWETVDDSASYTITFADGNEAVVSYSSCSGTYEYSEEQSKISVFFECLDDRTDYFIDDESDLPDILIVSALGNNTPDEGIKLKFLKI
ncbi:MULTISPECIES: hypothetical protein [Flagellimonas]|jgi:hypothetical protein|uniref:Lipocalin-like domain-containing protein n=2 Tax=Flagellimonas TaxID=444459 RepID=A0AAU7MTH8_9FLAO|nr:hypothetical protein [[Muricauda] okinawensis]MDF0708248.1 hypothetical protein [[Muricauda] okinawensis]